MWYVLPGLVFVAIWASDIAWPWAPNGGVVAAVGIGAGYIAGKILDLILFLSRWVIGPWRGVGVLEDAKGEELGTIRAAPSSAAWRPYLLRVRRPAFVLLLAAIWLMIEYPSGLWIFLVAAAWYSSLEGPHKIRG